MNDERRDQLLDAYRQSRLGPQRAYYSLRARRLENARRSALSATAALLVLAALFGALATADPDHRSLLAFVAASLSALATAITSYEAVSGFERLSRRYEETSHALDLADAFGPRPQDLAQLATESERDRAVTAFVVRTERLLRSETDTWSRQAITPPEQHHTDPGP